MNTGIFKLSTIIFFRIFYELCCPQKPSTLVQFLLDLSVPKVISGCQLKNFTLKDVLNFFYGLHMYEKNPID